MKSLKLLLLLALIAPFARCQQYQFTAPDCEYSFRYAVANSVVTPQPAPLGGTRVPASADVSSQAGYDNRYKNCVTWTMAYHVDGPSAVSIELDEAVTTGGVPGAWTIWPAAQVAPGTTQPLTATTFNQVSAFTYFPWVSTILNSATGNGQVEGHVYGWRAAPGQDASTTGTTVISRFNPATAQSSSSSQQTPETASSGTLAATAGTCTLAASAGKTTYITGFQITGAGATAASVIAPTVTGVITGTMTYELVIPAGVTTSITPLIVTFPVPVPASALNTTIVINVPSFGAGSTNASCVAQGFQSN